VFLVDIVHCGETTSSDQILAEAFQESSAWHTCWWNLPSAWQCVTTHKLENIGRSHKTLTVLPHPPYNPHLASLNFHLFGAL
jgi:hypothetical protein